MPTDVIEADRHLRRAGSEYRDAFLTLLPQGQAWPRHTLDSVLWQTADGLCNYWGFVDGRAGDLLEIESDPRKTTELLTDWERNWGLPDPCMLNPPTEEDARRLALVLKMTMLGGQSRQFFIDVALEFGHVITITEYAPYMCGISCVGDTRGIFNPDDPFQWRWQLGPPELRYYWTVHISGVELKRFHTGDMPIPNECGVDPIGRLLSFDNADDLECILDRLKPAHTDIVYDYSGTWGGVGPPISVIPPTIDVV